MKIFELCICALTYISLTSTTTIISKLEAQPNDEMKFLNTCMTEIGVTYEDDYDIRDIMADTIDKPELEERTQKHGCVIECFLRKMSWMEGSELKEERLYADINKVFINHPLKIQVEEFINDCVRKVKHATQENCQRGIVIMKCGVKGIYKLFPSALIGNERHEENEEDNNN